MIVPVAPSSTTVATVQSSQLAPVPDESELGTATAVEETAEAAGGADDDWGASGVGVAVTTTGAVGDGASDGAAASSTKRPRCLVPVGGCQLPRDRQLAGLRALHRLQDGVAARRDRAAVDHVPASSRP